MKTKRSHKTNYTNKKSNHNSTKSKILLTGVTLSSALVMSRPIIPAAVYAATNKYDWTKQEELASTGTAITSVASSASGNKLITSVVNYTGEYPTHSFPLYISSNYGVTWTNAAETVDPGVANFWTSVDVSNDGQTMVATSMGGFDLNVEDNIDGKVIMSEDGGNSWSNITSDLPIDGGEINAVISGDASTVAVTLQNDTVYVSKNDGATWTSNDINPEDSHGIASLSISENGDKLLVGAAGSGNEFDDVYISEDSGATWTGIDPDPETMKIVARTAMSADGNRIAVAATGGNDFENATDPVYISDNGGETWTNVTPDDSVFSFWGGIDMSDDGSKLALFGIDYANSDGGENAPLSMYVSDDSGANWTAEDPTEDGSNTGSIIDYYYGSIAKLNASGSRAIIGSVGGVYTGELIGSGSTVTLDDAVGGKTIALSTPDGTTITCHEAVKESGLTAIDNAYTYPLGLIDFCFSGANTNNEISIVFVTDLKSNQVVARKYNTTNSSYSTLTDATITETTYNNQHALQVTYNLTDNGPLDLDPAAGSVKDPVGLATQDVSGPNTGIAPQSSTDTTTILLTGLAVTAGLLTAPLRRAASRLSVKK